MFCSYGDAACPPIQAQGERGLHSEAIGPCCSSRCGLALLPKLTCPVCWPAYTALLSSVGINFVDYPYLLPTLTTFLAIALWALSYRAATRRGDSDSS